MLNYIHKLPIPTATCQPKPTIVFADPAFGTNSYRVTNILTYKRCEDVADGSYFITQNGKLNHIIIIDFGCEVAIKKFLLRNVRHRGVRYTVFDILFV